MRPSFHALVPLLLLLAFPIAADGGGRDEVFLYYANENAPDAAEDRNYATMKAWFGGSPEPKLRQIAAYLDEDRILFQAAVDVEIGDLTRGPSSALFFTNRLVRAGKCLVVRPGADPVEVPFAVAADPNYILAANPLAKAETLTAALAFARREFPADRHEFVLAVKSHGNAKKVVTPRWIVRSEETTREEILAVSAGTHTGPPPTWAGRLGIAKPDFLRVLAESGMRFPLVYVEACGTDTPEFGREFLPANVDRLLHIRQGAGKINMIYGDVRRDQRRGERFWESMLRHRTPKFVLVEREPVVAASEPVAAVRRPFPWPYLLPLAGWLGWVFGYRTAKVRLTKRGFEPG